MNWFRLWQGTACDPKWIGVALTAGDDVTPGHCPALWLAMLEYANAQLDRGSIVGFSTAQTAALFQWPPEMVVRIFDAMRSAGMHDGERISRWEHRQPCYEDRTAAERMRRYRLRKKASADCNAVTTVTLQRNEKPALRRNFRNVTTDKSSSFDLSLNSRANKSKTTSRNDARERARERLSVSGIWAALESLGIPVGLIAKASKRGTIQRWSDAGLTSERLSDAVAKATAARARAGDSSPVNIGYLDGFVVGRFGNDVGKGFAVADALTREFLERTT